MDQPGALSEAGRQAPYLFAEALVAAGRKQQRQALEAFDAAVRLAPEEAYLRLEYARLLGQLGRESSSGSERRERYALAREQLVAAAGFSGENPELAKEIGLLYLDLSEGSEQIVELARQSLEKARISWPEDPELLVPLGQIYRAQGKLEPAVEALRTAVVNVPGNVWVESLLTRSLGDLTEERLKAGQIDQAEGYLTEILAMDPGNSDALALLADILGQRGDHAGAAEALRGIRAEAMRPELARRLVWELYQAGDVEAAASLASGLELDEEGTAETLQILLLAAQGRGDEAAEILARDVAESAGNAVVAGALSQTLVNHGQAAQARHLLAGVVERLEAAAEASGDPGDAGGLSLVRVELAQLVADDGEWQEVLEILNPLRTQSGEEREVAGEGWKLLYADALERLGRGEEALELLPERVGRKDAERAAELLPLVARRAEALFQLGREDEAQDVLDDLAADEDADALLAAARVYQRLERYPQAIPLLRRFLILAPDSVEGLYFLGSAYERTGVLEASVATFRRLLELAPDFAPALNYLGYLWAERGENLEEALSLIERAVAQEPHNGAYVDSLGWVHYQLGDYARARERLELAVQLEPEDATIFEHLGDVYVALGHLDLAQKVYQRSLALGDENAETVRRKLEKIARIDPPPPGR